MKKIIFLLGIIVIAFLAYNYIYKSHRDIKTEKVAFSITSKALFDEFSSNPKASQTKYLNKTIKVSGSVIETNTNTITLNQNVFCIFEAPISKAADNSRITIKGRLIGYDDLLEEIKLDQCYIISNQ
ncbi:OB-fold protein [Hyunsoonleella sp. 2307UL5-6]|uniref:OB-fold protein n=1 Tax=Hyunsoonleella sp. 2307UL5-6 TaxID=3384768 RepID=UPI0039BCF9D2